MTTISGVSIGPGEPCRVVAELSNAHNGKLENALRLIEGAASAGADFVKFQCYTPDELVRLRGDGPAPSPWGSMGWTMRALYEKAQTPHEWFPQLVAKFASPTWGAPSNAGTLVPEGFTYRSDSRPMSAHALREMVGA